MIEKLLERIAVSLETIAACQVARSTQQGLDVPNSKSVDTEDSATESKPATSKKKASSKKKAASKKVASKAKKDDDLDDDDLDEESQFADADAFKKACVDTAKASGVPEELKQLKAFISSEGYKSIAEVEPENYDEFYTKVTKTFEDLAKENSEELEDDLDI